MLIIVGFIYEFIDFVCFIGNCFFGKMGMVFVEEVSRRGVKVMLVLGLSVLSIIDG